MSLRALMPIPGFWILHRGAAAISESQTSQPQIFISDDRFTDARGAF